MRTKREKLAIIIDLLKKHLPNMPPVQLVGLAATILEAIEYE
jgi:hypothetical protein